MTIDDYIKQHQLRQTSGSAALSDKFPMNDKVKFYASDDGLREAAVAELENIFWVSRQLPYGDIKKEKGVLAEDNSRLGIF